MRALILFVVVSILTTAILVSVSCKGSGKVSRGEPGVPDPELIETGLITGMMHHGLGGALIAPGLVAFVGHWPLQDQQVVEFRGRDGKYHKRIVIEVLDYGSDLVVLLLDRELSPMNHHIFSIAQIDPRRPVYSVTHDYSLKRFQVQIATGPILKMFSTQSHKLDYGDSGGAWLQYNGDEIVVVGLNSTMRGTGPNLFSLFSKKNLQ